MSIFFRFLKNPGAYFHKLRYLLGGVYFDFFLKKYHFNGCEFEVPADLTSRTDRGYFTFGEYEKNECELLIEALSPDSKVIELGGCIGVVSCMANRMLGCPELHVVVEPNSRLIPYLQMNREKNHARFQIENAVISTSPEVLFYEGKSMVVGGLQNSGGKAAISKGTGFAELEAKYAVRFDTLIMDIEGAEMELIMQNKSYIRGLHSILMENHPHLLGEKVAIYENFLLEAGFLKKTEHGSVTLWQKSGKVIPED